MPLETVKAFRQNEHKPCFRHIRKIFPAVIGIVEQDASIPAYCYFGIHHRLGCGGKDKFHVYFHRFGAYLPFVRPFGGIGSRISPDHGAVGLLASPIVIRTRSPEIAFHRRLQIFPAVPADAVKISGTF